jgi:hypothetical protein
VVLRTSDSFGKTWTGTVSFPVGETTFRFMVKNDFAWEGRTPIYVLDVLRPSRVCPEV